MRSPSNELRTARTTKSRERSRLEYNNNGKIHNIHTHILQCTRPCWAHVRTGPASETCHRAKFLDGNSFKEIYSYRWQTTRATTAAEVAVWFCWPNKHAERTPHNIVVCVRTPNNASNIVRCARRIADAQGIHITSSKVAMCATNNNHRPSAPTKPSHSQRSARARVYLIESWPTKLTSLCATKLCVQKCNSFEISCRFGQGIMKMFGSAGD